MTPEQITKLNEAAAILKGISEPPAAPNPAAETAEVTPTEFAKAISDDLAKAASDAKDGRAGMAKARVDRVRSFLGKAVETLSARKGDETTEPKLSVFKGEPKVDSAAPAGEIAKTVGEAVAKAFEPVMKAFEALKGQFPPAGGSKKPLTPEEEAAAAEEDKKKKAEAEKKAAEEVTAKKAADDKAAADKKAADEKAAADKKAEEEKKAKEAEAAKKFAWSRDLAGDMRAEEAKADAENNKGRKSGETTVAKAAGDDLGFGADPEGVRDLSKAGS